MHEMHVIRKLFDDLLKLAQEQGTRKVTDVYIAMGEFTEINPQILEYFFREHGKDTPLSEACLHIEKSPLRELRLVSFDCE